MNSEAVTKTLDNGSTAGHAGRKNLRSLTISPNLDKLLEHEERLRSSRMTSPMISTGERRSSNLSTGLPPPPRRDRPMQSSTAQSIGPTTGMISEVSTAIDDEDYTPGPLLLNSSQSPRNPFINPAPAVEELFRSRDPVWPSQQSSPLRQKSSFRRNGTDTLAICFKVKTPKKIGKFIAPLTLPVGRLSNKLIKNHYRDYDDLISHGQMSEDGTLTGFASSSVDFQARIDISHPTVKSPDLDCQYSRPVDDSPDPVPHPVSSIEIHSQTQRTKSNLKHSSSQAMLDSVSNTSSHPINSKPPLPTTPKPVVTRRPPVLVKQSLSPAQDRPSVKPMTTNFLDLDERAELVRKSRKLARVFGETPNADAVLNHGNSAIRRMDHEFDNKGKPRRERRVAGHRSSHARRRSVPFVPDDVSFISVNFEEDQVLPSATPHKLASTSQKKTRERQDPIPIRSHSPVSYIDLSDDGSSTIDKLSTPSLLETTTIDEREEDRRRKRDRLTKLHWFLGSQVPANLVLGLPDTAASLPPLQPSFFDIDDNPRKIWTKRRRSNSVIMSPDVWSDDLERLKADLDEKEKAIIVRRAQKMEKVFGVAPPLALYCTSTTPPSLSRSAPPSASPSSVDLPSSLAPSKLQKKKGTRPTTPESGKHLLKDETLLSMFNRSLRTEPSNKPKPSGSYQNYSFHYSQYAQSLNSLNDIIDRDDVASLAELHQVLSDEEDAITLSRDNASIATLSIRSERRRSLPTRTSITSFDSENSVNSPPLRPDAASFQWRRKKAAKLTQFFGVDYRILIDDVLESIENGMRIDQQHGVLHAEEIEDLLHKLRKLKLKRQNFL